MEAVGAFLLVAGGLLLPAGAAIGAVGAAVALLVYRHSVQASRAKQQLIEERRRFTAMLEGAQVGLFESVMPEDRIYVNESWAAMLGRKADFSKPMTQAQWQSLIHPDDRKAVIKSVMDSIKNHDGSFQSDYRIRHADGQWVWVLSHGTVIERAPDGVPRRAVGTHSDITQRKQAESALLESERRFRSLFERAPVGIALTEYRTRRFLQVNDALLEPSGFTREEMLGMTYDQLVALQVGPPLSNLAATREQEFRRKDGTTYPVSISSIRMTDASGRDVVWSVVQDISHRKLVERELAAAARRDLLTGLGNRAAFLERLHEAQHRVRRGEQTMFAVLFLDFDRFKVVNDAMGHQAGDELLKQISARLRGTVRLVRPPADEVLAPHIARFGGDEFLILVNDLSQADDAVRIADRLQQVLAAPFSIDGREVHSSASIGIVSSDTCADDAEAIIRNADVAMYEAKHAGRARSVVFNDEMHRRLSRKLVIETALRKALGTDQLTLVYQPIVELDTGRRSSVETLLRWNHPTLGPISPAEFIPVAEESGLIIALGQWVMHESCAALVRWRQLDPDKAPRVVSVNVSRAELAQGPLLFDTVRSALEASRLPPDSLQLEVTEREVMRDPQASLELMHQLHAIGVRLAMDDFGTGTSSLGCLRDYPFDVIKIDRSFMTGLAGGPDTLAVIHAVVTLVENLGKSSVAEGVETAEQLAILQSLGCHYAQGYFLGRPMPESEVVEVERTIVAPRIKLA